MKTKIENEHNERCEYCRFGFNHTGKQHERSIRAYVKQVRVKYISLMRHVAQWSDFK